MAENDCNGCEDNLVTVPAGPIGPEGPQGIQGIQGIQGKGITSTSWTSNSAGESQGTQGTTDTYTVTYTDATTDTFVVYNGEDANSDYGYTLFVDYSFGNNTTGTRERFDLPYKTIAGALADSVSGDAIIVRAGSYSEGITLKDGIDIHFEANTIITGSITDSGNSVNCNISGYLKSTATNDAIHITGSNSNVNISMDSLSPTSVALLVRPVEAAGVEANVTLTANKITNLFSNYFFTIYGNANVVIDIKEKVITQANTSNASGFAGFWTDADFRGTIHFKCPYVFIGDSGHDDAGILYTDNAGNTTGGKVFLDIGIFNCTYDLSPHTSRGIIDKNGESQTIINIEDFYSIKRTPIKISGDNTTGTIIVNGRFTSKEYPCIHYRSNQRATFSGVYKREGGGTNEGLVVMAGENNDYGTITGVDTGWKLQLKNATIVKTGAGAVGPLVLKKGTTDNSDVYLINVNLDHKATGLTPDLRAISGTTTGVDDSFYVINTVGNVINTSSIVVYSSVESYVYDAPYRQFEDLIL